MRQISSDDLNRLRDTTFVRQIQYFAELESTNTRAIELARGGRLETPLLVLTERQTAGRGQRVRRWWSAPGALTFSLVLDNNPPADCSPPPISLVTALAVAAALCELVPDSAIGLKWPNDVLLDERKVCGILIESAQCDDGQSRHVIGIGVNVANCSVDAPAELRDSMISLAERAETGLKLARVLETILQQLAKKQQQVAEGALDLSVEWNQRCSLTGKTAYIESSAMNLAGICRGIDPIGRLLIADGGEIHRLASGTVTKVEPAAETG